MVVKLTGKVNGETIIFERKAGGLWVTQDVSLPLPVLPFPGAKTLLQCAFPPVPCYKTASVSIPFPGTGCTWHLHPNPSKSVFYVVIRLLVVSGQRSYRVGQIHDLSAQKQLFCQVFRCCDSKMLLKLLVF